MVGRDNTRVEALDHSMLIDLMRRYGRLTENR
jgi:D-aminopeptidase